MFKDPKVRFKFLVLSEQESKKQTQTFRLHCKLDHLDLFKPDMSSRL